MGLRGDSCVWKVHVAEEDADAEEALDLMKSDPMDAKFEARWSATETAVKKWKKLHRVASAGHESEGSEAGTPRWQGAEAGPAL